MIPGLITRLSEAVISLTNIIAPRTDIVRVSSTATTTVLVTINGPFPNMGGVLYVVNSSGAAITTTAAGNIATTSSIPNGCFATFVYSKTSLKWHVEKTT